jgi:hypothetical protein
VRLVVILLLSAALPGSLIVAVRVPVASSSVLLCGAPQAGIYAGARQLSG